MVFVERVLYSRRDLERILEEDEEEERKREEYGLLFPHGSHDLESMLEESFYKFLRRPLHGDI